jgi:hypothetical protein
MYSLIVDGVDSSANGNFENFSDALWWYDYVIERGASNVVLWRNQELIKFFVRGE